MLPAGEIRTRAMVTLDLRTGSGNEIRVGPFESDLSISGLSAEYKTPVPCMDRGTYYGSVEGDDIFPEIGLSVAHMGKLSTAAAQTVADIIEHAGAFSADVTTDMNGRIWMLKAIITITGRDGVDVRVAPNSKWTFDYSAGERNVLSLKATCYRPTPGDDLANNPNNNPIYSM